MDVFDRVARKQAMESRGATYMSLKRLFTFREYISASTDMLSGASLGYTPTCFRQRRVSPVIASRLHFRGSLEKASPIHASFYSLIRLHMPINNPVVYHSTDIETAFCATPFES